MVGLKVGCGEIVGAEGFAVGIEVGLVGQTDGTNEG